MAPRLFWTKRNETLWNFFLKKISLGGFTLLDSRLETRLIYRYLSNKPGGGGGCLNCPASVSCLMHDIRNRKVPSNILNLFSDTTSVHSYNSRSSPSNNFYIKKSRLDIQKRAFSRVRGKIWNEIPALLREQLLPKNASKRNSTLSLLISWNMMTILLFPKLHLLWKRKIELLKVTSFQRT